MGTHMEDLDLPMWEAAQIIYLNSCQSRFSGVYLVL